MMGSGKGRPNVLSLAVVKCGCRNQSSGLLVIRELARYSAKFQEILAMDSSSVLVGTCA